MRTILPILIGGLLLHGVITLTPHQHGTDVPHAAASVADHWCSHETPEIFPFAEIHVAAKCLACVIPTPAFAPPDHPFFVVSRASTLADPAASDQLPAPSRRWQIQLRGPPSHA
jgi:hypothetical protein